VLQALLENSKHEADERMASKGKGKADSNEAADLDEEVMSAHAARRHAVARVVYEVTGESGRIEPQLRLWVDPPSPSSPTETTGLEESEDSSERETEVDPDDEELVEEEFGGSHMSLLWALQRRSMLAAAEEAEQAVEVPLSE
jgi:hypothetical protein